MVEMFFLNILLVIFGIYLRAHEMSLVFYKSRFFNAAKKHGIKCKKTWHKVQNILSIESVF
ncbi:hypothetical protein ASG65_20645 [Bacillus sp. Leaf13]|nr:hypothetical protein ASG65_20645 [Bacillus sp. Leaf13]